MALCVSAGCVPSETAATMKTVPLRHLLSVTTHSFPRRRKRSPENPFRIQRFHLHIPTGRFHIHCKRTELQDSNGYAKPSRLLPATEVKVCTDNSVEKNLSSLRDDEYSQYLYKVKLGTSNAYGSSLSDLNAGILLCLIDENGDSILQRIPSSSIADHSTDSEEGILHFEVLLMSSASRDLNLEKLKLFGSVLNQWRLGNMSLTVICGQQSSLDDNDREKLEYIGFNYNFEVEDILLGEGSDSSMVQLRPSLVTNLSGVDPFTIFNKSLPESTLLVSRGISNEETMKEYADLKLSLLLYDAMLIIVGTSLASLSAVENAGFAFLTGGMAGFFYLLLLQRSVDGLPAAELASESTGRTNRIFGGSKAPLFGVALAIISTVFTVKYGYWDVPVAFTPKEILVGFGFLACKVAVVLASIKPLPLSLKINE